MLFADNTEMQSREQLYHDYSDAFGGAKRLDCRMAFAQYDLCYPDLDISREGPIADLGCGKGEWLLWLRAKGFTNLWGVDYSSSELQFIPPASGIRTEQGNAISFLTSRPSQFDLLHAKDVIEHLTEDEVMDFLRACKAALRPGGRLWLLTFNAQSPFANATRYGDFTHRIGLTPSSFAQVLRSTGFFVESIQGIHICPLTPSGRARKTAWRFLTPFFKFILMARHGTGITDGAVDHMATAPDLFAKARLLESEH
jgi:2-polyprenyl-3-methyl-5-hydroxy-6-metoxy-1,4-benzoquinol methylase